MFNFKTILNSKLRKLKQTPYDIEISTRKSNCPFDIFTKKEKPIAWKFEMWRWKKCRKKNFTL